MRSLNLSSARQCRWLFSYCGVVLATLFLCSFARADDSLAKLKPFFKQHCFECHGSKKQKGDIRIDNLGKDLANHETLEIWQGILDQLNLGEMPPKKQPQPTHAEVRPVIDTLTRALALAYEKARSTGAQTVLRRLNRHELRNTLRDLLYLEGADYRPDSGGSRLVDNNGNGSVERTGSDPLRFFPEDEEEEGNVDSRLIELKEKLKKTKAKHQESSHIVKIFCVRVQPRASDHKAAFWQRHLGEAIPDLVQRPEDRCGGEKSRTPCGF